MRSKDPIYPGEFILEEFLLRVNKSQRELAEELGWTPARLNELIKSKREVTAEAALDLASVLRTSPEVWMNLQSHFDLAQARKRRKKRRDSFIWMIQPTQRP